MVEENRRIKTREDFEKKYIESCQGDSLLGGRSNIVDQHNVVTKDEIASYSSLVGVAV